MGIPNVHAKANLDIKADVTPAIQATSDIVSSSNKGIGKLLNATIGPWIANRQRLVALINAQTVRECRQIENGELSFRDGKLLPELNSSSNAFLVLNELNHRGDAKRFEATIREAVRQISSVPDDQVSDEPISQTFFNRWRREAEMIGEEDLRQFWASLLVEETKQPGRISPRTLDVARNLSLEEARLFERMAKFTFEDALIVDNKGCPPGGRYVDILKLINAGLLGSQTSERSFPLKTEGSEQKPYADLLFTNDGYLIRCFGDEGRVSCRVLTNEGVALLKILNVCRTQEDIVAIAKTVAAQVHHRLVSVHKIISVKATEQRVFYQYQSEPVWTTKKTEESDAHGM